MSTVTYPYLSSLHSQFREEGRAEGREEGRAEGQAQSRAADILRILDRRGIAVGAEARQRIESCGDLEVLGTWLDRSITAEKASDLFS